MEKKLDGLVALLAPPEAPRPLAPTERAQSNVPPYRNPHASLPSPSDSNGREHVQNMNHPSHKEYAVAPLQCQHHESTSQSSASLSQVSRSSCAGHESIATPGLSCPCSELESPTDTCPCCDDLDNPNPACACSHARPEPPSLRQPSATDYETEFQNQMTGGLVDRTQAEKRLYEYRSMAEFCPFVTIPQEMTAALMCLQKPMLLLAILMTASSSSRPLQIALEERYRTELATKVMIQRRRSLDYLQSLLVYLSW